VCEESGGMEYSLIDFLPIIAVYPIKNNPQTPAVILTKNISEGYQ
jgi:hypothetical protein